MEHDHASEYHAGIAAFPLVDRVMDFLRATPDEEQAYRFVEDAAQAITVALDVLFSGLYETKEPLEELLRLACALELEMRSPGAAAVIKSALSCDPRAANVLGMQLVPADADGAVPDERVLDYVPARVKSAPAFPEGESPAGSLKVAALLDPRERCGARRVGGRYFKLLFKKRR